MKTLLTVVLNFLIGVVGIAVLITQLTSGEGVKSEGGTTSVGFQLDTFGIIAWVVGIVLYFWLAKKYLGKTVGAKLLDLVTGNAGTKKKR